MPIPLLRVWQEFHLFHYALEQAAFYRFWDLRKGRDDDHVSEEYIQQK